MQKIRIDFDNPGLPQHISAVENDSQSRFFQATLYENGKAYTAPAGASYSIMYRGFGPQNQGWYDTINDGAGKRAACAVSGNVVTCEIARQALQVPGHVSIVLCVTTEKGYMLKSWPIECDCKNDRYDSTAEIQSFFYITQVSNADWNRAIQAVEELKNIIDPTLSLSGKAADAKATGDAVGELKEDLGEIYETDITSIGEYRQGQYVEYLTGKIKPSDNYEMLVFANKQYDKISVLCGHTDNIPASVAFFSNMTTDPTSYLNQSVKATTGEKNYIVSIPSDCKTIAISNRKRDYEIKGSVSYSTDVALKQSSQNGEEIQVLQNAQKNSDLLQGCFVADKYNDSSLVKDGLIFDDGNIFNTNKNKYTLYISLENVRYIKYKNLYGKYEYGGKNLVGMTFYDEYHVISKSPEFTSELQAGVIDLYDFPDAKYMRFCNYSNDIPVSVELYCETEKEAKDRKKVYIGAYYFGGWSEWELPNLHFTKDLLQDFNGRMPVWGWFANGSYRCDAWLYSPYINLNSGESILSLTGSCVFNALNCSVNVKPVDGNWTPLQITFDNTDPEIKTKTVDISSFSGKRIMLGFRILNKNSDISPIWTINKVKITSGNEIVHTRDFTGNNTRDYTTNDEETWKHGIPTLAYDVTNGYVGTAYDTGNATIIDKEIILAKNKGIDYFILDWYYHNNGGSFDKDETEKEPNNLELQTFSKSAQKYNFKYTILISNHGGFIIDGLENWKSAINYINETYVKDPSYFRYKGTPVISVFEATKFNEVKAQINEYIISLGYPNGWIWQIVNENTSYGYWYSKHDENTPDTEQPYSKLINDTKSRVDKMYYAVHDVYPCITSGSDLRPWKNRPDGYARHLDYCIPSVTEWKDFAQWAYDWVHAYKRDFKSIVVYAWNEMGEGGYLVPTAGDPQASFLCALEEVINSNSYPS